MAIRNDNTKGKNRERSSYEPSLIDLRFLKATDMLIKENKKANVKPDTESAISKMIFGNGSIIRKIRASQRGISMLQLQKFAIYFHLDFNYFFRYTMSLEYNPQVAGGNENTITGEHIDIIGKMIGSNVYKGDVYKGSKIIRVEKIIFL